MESFIVGSLTLHPLHWLLPVPPKPTHYVKSHTVLYALCNSKYVSNR
jgi:hypothetical protein